MEIKAGAKYLRGSPRKVRLVAQVANGLVPSEAISRLTLMRQKPRLAVIKVIKQAVANAKNNFKLEPDDLVIKQIWVNEGPRFKRIDKSHGARFDGGVIKKKFYHLEVILQSKPELTKEKSQEKPVEVKAAKLNKEDSKTIKKQRRVSQTQPAKQAQKEDGK